MTSNNPTFTNLTKTQTEMTIFYVLIAVVISSIIITTIKMHSAHKKELNEVLQLFDDR
jgi:ABC-type lipoprotein release transport system permease subunit